MNIKVIAFYHFFKPNFDLELTKATLRQRMISWGIKGTILLAPEGINSTIAGPVEFMDSFMKFLMENIHVSNLTQKISFCEEIPFKRTIVKVKKTIVPEPDKAPVDLSRPAPYISPSELDEWIKDGKDMVILDTRNDYEYELGRFKDAVHLGTKNFADFGEDLKKTPQDWKDKTIVTFCTGGIRCEKAAPLMLQKGFHKIYQLEGGILNYFEKVGRSNFEGDCFVFDERVGLNEKLKAQENQ